MLRFAAVSASVGSWLSSAAAGAQLPTMASRRAASLACSTVQFCASAFALAFSTFSAAAPWGPSLSAALSIGVRSRHWGQAMTTGHCCPSMRVESFIDPGSFQEPQFSHLNRLSLSWTCHVSLSPSAAFLILTLIWSDGHRSHPIRSFPSSLSSRFVPGRYSC